MYYFIWIATACVAVALGVYAATRIDKKENKK